LDTNGDTLSASWVTIYDADTFVVPNGGPSIINSSLGNLFASGFGSILTSFNPTSRTLLGSTTDVSGVIGNLATNDNLLYMVFASYMAGIVDDLDDYVDNNASDVDSSADEGSHSNFNNEKANDTVMDTLSEGIDTDLGSEVTIENNLLDAKDEYNPSPSSVFISDKVGYTFYIDKAGPGDDDPRYSKTTDGGATWGGEVDLGDGNKWANIAVWYDQWTPGGSGTKIHMLATETDTDDTYYCVGWTLVVIH